MTPLPVSTAFNAIVQSIALGGPLSVIFDGVMVNGII